MPKRINMTLVTITTKTPISILFFRKAPSNDVIMETLGNAILDNMEIHDKPIDSYFRIERDSIAEDMIE